MLYNPQVVTGSVSGAKKNPGTFFMHLPIRHDVRLRSRTVTQEIERWRSSPKRKACAKLWRPHGTHAEWIQGEEGRNEDREGSGALRCVALPIREPALQAIKELIRATSLTLTFPPLTPPPPPVRPLH